MVEGKPPLVDPLNAFCKDTEAYLIGTVSYTHLTLPTSDLV